MIQIRNHVQHSVLVKERDSFVGIKTTKDNWVSKFRQLIHLQHCNIFLCTLFWSWDSYGMEKSHICKSGYWIENSEALKNPIHSISCLLFFPVHFHEWIWHCCNSQFSTPIYLFKQILFIILIYLTSSINSRNQPNFVSLIQQES